ncbi:b39 [miniopterid betaherpesvirus 1]|uniref:B39 n=1 Tax=miniopterid betaherpesvirus 1 TaxID=3070189 RepID=I3VQ15_9BETA|nr:b39 [miniopterid betaherpesvirus 1]AFK83859.1 b39 [miniopterid betaherpesvirus 1]
MMRVSAYVFCLKWVGAVSGVIYNVTAWTMKRDGFSSGSEIVVSQSVLSLGDRRVAYSGWDDMNHILDRYANDNYMLANVVAFMVFSETDWKAQRNLMRNDTGDNVNRTVSFTRQCDCDRIRTNVEVIVKLYEGSQVCVNATHLTDRDSVWKMSDVKCNWSYSIDISDMINKTKSFCAVRLCDTRHPDVFLDSYEVNSTHSTLTCSARRFPGSVRVRWDKRGPDYEGLSVSAVTETVDVDVSTTVLSGEVPDRVCRVEHPNSRTVVSVAVANGTDLSSNCISSSLLFRCEASLRALQSVVYVLIVFAAGFLIYNLCTVLDVCGAVKTRVERALTCVVADVKGVSSAYRMSDGPRRRRGRREVEVDLMDDTDGIDESCVGNVTVYNF